MKNKNNKQWEWGGRPPIFKTAEELDKKVAEYFKTAWKRVQTWEEMQTIYTMTWLALHLWFCSRQSMYDYEKKEMFSYSIKKARTLIELEYETRLSMWSPTWAIFALKNMGWADKIQVNNKHSGKIKRSLDLAQLASNYFYNDQKDPEA